MQNKHGLETMVMSDECEKLIKIPDSPSVFLHVYVLDF